MTLILTLLYDRNTSLEFLPHPVSSECTDSNSTATEETTVLKVFIKNVNGDISELGKSN